MPEDARSGFARAVAFETRLQDASAERFESFPEGRAYFNDSFPRVYDLNALRVEDPSPGVSAKSLAAAAELLHTAAGQAHRRVVVPDPTAGERLAPGFKDLGWEVRRFLFMGHLRAPDNAARAAAVEELDEATHWDAKREFMASAPEAYDDSVVQQLLEKDRLKEGVVEFARFGVRADGEVVSVCELYSDGKTAQVEDVSTSPGFRGRGYARSTILAALEVAEDKGCDFVFLVADAEDWPKELYSKIGFDPLGVVYDFLKMPTGG